MDKMGNNIRVYTAYASELFPILYKYPNNFVREKSFNDQVVAQNASE